MRVSFAVFNTDTCCVRLETLSRMLFHSRSAGLFVFVRALFAGVSNADRELWSRSRGISPARLRASNESSTVVVRSTRVVDSIEVLVSANVLIGDVWASR